MKTTTTFLAVSAFSASLAFGALAQETTEGADDTPISAATVLATVGDTDITLGHMVALRGRLPEQYQSLDDHVLYDGILEQLIRQTALMQWMEGQIDTRTTLALDNEVRAFMANEALARVSEKPVDNAALVAAYDERYDAAVPDQQFDASHILVATLEEALALVAQLQDGADFAELAKEHSTGPSGPSGGGLGWFGKGQMVESFENAVIELAVDEISPPVVTQFGWHVIKLNDIRDIQVPTLDDVRAELTMELQQAMVESAVDDIVATITVSRNDVGVDPSAIRDVSIFNR